MADRRGRMLLRDRVSSIAMLAAAWLKVSRGSKAKSKGVDGVELQQFRRHATSELKRLHRELRDGSYKHAKYYGHAIPKGADHRPISVATIRDRVVQRATLDAIWTKVRDRVADRRLRSSFGGVREYHVRKPKTTEDAEKRKREFDIGRNVAAAAARVNELRAEGKVWVFETDIVNFFPTIDKDRLKRDLSVALGGDSSIDDILESAIDTGVSNIDDLGPLASKWDAEKGVPQGGVLSPVLANFYLHELDQAMADAGLAMVRYVDDLIVLTESEAEAKRAYALVSVKLRDLRLQRHDLDKEVNGKTKTRIVPPGAPFDFLGLTFNRNSIRPKEERFKRLEERLSDATNEEARPPITVMKAIQRSNSIMSGWLASYAMCDIKTRDLDRIDNFARRRIGGFMEKIGILRNANRLDHLQYRRLGLDSAAFVWRRHTARPPAFVTSGGGVIREIRPPNATIQPPW